MCHIELVLYFTVCHDTYTVLCHVYSVTVSVVYVVGCSSVQAGLISLLCTMDLNYLNTCVTLQSQNCSDKLVWINEQPLRLWYTLKCVGMTN